MAIFRGKLPLNKLNSRCTLYVAVSRHTEGPTFLVENSTKA